MWLLYLQSYKLRTRLTQASKESNEYSSFLSVLFARDLPPEMNMNKT